jgi:adenosine kinase
MNTLICGSLAYDTIMVFPDKFKNHILADQLHILNVSFFVPEMRREFGGCSGNIAYNLKLLGGNPLMMATVGDDFAPYSVRLDKLALSQKHVSVVKDTFTAQAFITTDLDDNQITAFHPGAMSQSHLNKIADAQNVSLGIVSPDGRDGMVQHARGFHAAKIPFIFDPGQGMPMFDGKDLLEFIDLASYVTLNDYEAKMLEERTGKTIAQIAKLVKAMIVTRGGEGSTIIADDVEYKIPSVRASAIVDPTGCGDAYRAGLLYGISKGWDWSKTGKLASLMGSIKIASRGGQNHAPTRDDLAAQFALQFGMALD